MDAYYQGTYLDEHGEENIVIHNDGETLRLSIRGVEYVGVDFDGLLPINPEDARNKGFILGRHNGELVSGTISFVVPQPTITPTGDVVIDLTFNVTLPYGLHISTSLFGQQFQITPTSEFFDGMENIQKTLPEGVTMKCCATCAFSDLNPVGTPFFGGLLCFRDYKADYLQTRGKSEFMQFWKKDMAYWVQEIYLCAEFEKRTVAAGYRGL